MGQTQLEQGRQQTEAWRFTVMRELRGKVAQWLQDQDDPTLSARDFARQHGIAEGPWRSVYEGRAILSEKHRWVYALLYSMGIEAADPRTIPPMVRITPKKREPTFVPRAWSDEDYKAWLREQEMRQLPTDEMEEDLYTEAHRASADTELAEAVQVLLGCLAERVVEQIRFGIEKMDLPIRDLDQVSAGVLAQALELRIRRRIDEDPNAVEDLHVQHGAVFGRLLPLLDALTRSSPSERRRAAERLMTEVDL